MSDNNKEQPGQQAAQTVLDDLNNVPIDGEMGAQDFNGISDQPGQPDIDVNSLPHDPEMAEFLNSGIAMCFSMAEENRKSHGLAFEHWQPNPVALKDFSVSSAVVIRKYFGEMKSSPEIMMFMSGIGLFTFPIIGERQIKANIKNNQDKTENGNQPKSDQEQ